MSSPRAKQVRCGGAGSGKTLCSLRSPNPIVIDSEDGTQWYKDQFPNLEWFDKFEPEKLIGVSGAVVRVVTWEGLRDVVKWLLTTETSFSTLVIDGMTAFEKSLDDTWNKIFMLRNQKSVGFKMDFYVKQPADYKPQNADRDSFLRDLTMLDMSVIITCRMRDEYEKGELMKTTGEMVFDGHKTLMYWADTGLYQFRGKNGEFMAHVGFGDKSKERKDRTNRFPVGDFEMTDDLLVRLFGGGIVATSTPTKFATESQVSDILDCIVALMLDDKTIRKTMAEYNVSEWSDLTESSAIQLIERMNKAIKAKETKNADV